MQPSLRHRSTGWLILLTAVFYLCSKISLPGGEFWAIGAAWGAVICCWPNLSRSAHRQAGILFIAGSSLLGWGMIQGQSLDLVQALGRNLPLLTMFVAVSFLSLTNPSGQDQQPPRGKKGFWATLGACHLLGAVINLSVAFVVGDRLAKQGRLTDQQTQVIMRGFCSGAYWSPFFVAAGVAMTYAPGAVWLDTLVPGLIMTIPMVLITFWEVNRQGLQTFNGYPLQQDSLLMPVVLASIVMGIHFLFPHVHILTLISLIAPIGALCFMKQRPRYQVVHQYIKNRLSNVGSQFALFLAAGVFSSGISALIHGYPNLIQLQADSLNPWLFFLVSAVMILISQIGVHPVVSVALVSPLLMPIGASANQMAFLFLSVWGTATATSPLSGVGLAMISRYQAVAKRIVALNYRYMIGMWVFAGCVNWVIW